MRKNEKLPDYFVVSSEVRSALSSHQPVLALESTVITHGLPYPQNMQIATELEGIARKLDVTPATIVLINGKVHIGMGEAELKALSEQTQLAATQPGLLHKIALRDIPLAIAKGYSGGTTVSATLYLAHLAGIKVFATGGIGGVHRDWQNSLDISADLQAISAYPVIIVTAGCKAILDIPATLEHLETMSVPVYGWQTDYCPAFYTSRTNYPLDRADDVLTIARAYQSLVSLSSLTDVNSHASGVVIMNPIPTTAEIPSEQIEPVILQALAEAAALGISGKAVTPWLLSKLNQITAGKSVTANLALLRNNVRLGSEIASALSKEEL